MLITAKMLYMLGCCNDGIENAENIGLLPLDLDKLTVDFIVENKINLWSIAVGLQTNRSCNDELEIAQEDFNDATSNYYYWYSQSLYGLPSKVYYKRYAFELDYEEVPFAKEFVENYLPYLISFLRDNEELIVSETENFS